MMVPAAVDAVVVWPLPQVITAVYCGFAPGSAPVKLPTAPVNGVPSVALIVVASEAEAAGATVVVLEAVMLPPSVSVMVTVTGYWPAAV
jgi:hypothetical protein